MTRATDSGSLAGSLQDVVVEAAGTAVGGGAGEGVALLPSILGGAPIAVLVVDRAAGHVVYANAAALELAGDTGLPVPTDRWASVVGITDVDGTPLAQTSGPLSRVAAGEPVAGEPVRISGTPAVAGTDRGSSDLRGPVVWATGFPLDTDPAGEQLSLLVFLPVEQPTEEEGTGTVLQALRDKAVLATDICFTISDPQQPGNPLVWVNPAFTRVTGYTSAESVGRNCKFLQGPATDPAAVAQIVTDLDAGRSTSVTLLNYRPDGTSFWNHVSISPVRDGAGELVSFVGVQTDVTTRVVADAQRDAAHAAELAARQAAERAQGQAERAQADAEAARSRLALLAEASTALADSLDPDEVLRRLARLVVPLLADWVLIVQVDPAGTVTAIASQHRDGPAVASLLSQVEAQYLGRPLPASAPSALAIDRGEPVVIGELTPDAWRSYVGGLANTSVLKQLGTGSTLALPLTSRRGTWGAMALVRAETDAFTDTDLDVAQDLGRRAGQVLDNASNYTQEASVAEALQRALLPDLPPLPGVTAAAHYAAASASAAVGGDFYDLLALPGNRVGVVIGDVVGHDITAAAAMGQLRSLVRSESWHDDTPAPHTVLTRVDRLLEVLHLPVIATLALLRATPPQPAGAPSDTWVVECANAGHPPVLLRTPDGAVEAFCHDHGLLLGTGMAGSLPQRMSTTRAVPAGSQLLLYTDGLVEQPDPDRPGPGRDIDAGIARLTARWNALRPGADPTNVCDAVQTLATSPTDDVAVLVLQLGQAPTA